MHLPPREKLIVASVLKPDAKLSRLGSTAFVLWIIASLLLSVYLTDNYLLLIYLYGPSRVLSEHLTFTAMPKQDPWPVSNGDVVQYPDRFVGFPIALLAWSLLILFGYLALKALSQWQKQSAYRKLLDDI
jgi:hypothetical protein